VYCDSSIYTPGTYEGSAQGFGGIIKVKVTVDKNKITDVKAEGAKETKGVGSRAVEQLPSKIVAANSADVNIVSGATYSSKAIIASVKAALSQAKAAGNVAKKIIDGKYVTEAIGHEGTVTVCTTFIGGAIKSVQVLNHDETQGIGTFAIARVPKKIVEAQSINVDGVSGATVTSNVIKYAVSEAITKANGNIADFSKELAKSNIVKKEVKEDVQVAIMGAGTAGLYAANQLLEKGVKDVILFEKQDIPGGCMPVTYGGSVIAGSKIYSNWGLGTPFYSSWDNMKAGYKKMLDANGTKYNPDFPFISRLFQKTGEMYDWMSNVGIGFTTLGSSSGFSYPIFSPGVYEGGSGYAMEFLAKRIEQKGGRIIYATPVTDLIQDKNGKITGLVAEGKDGTTWKVNADAVVLASGSFANNKDLVTKYFPKWSGHSFNTIKSATGDGLLLGMKYGAGIEGMDAEVPGFMSSYDSHFELAFMHLTVPGIIVNINGNEFGNIIKLNHQVMSKAKADPANGDTFYYIFDEAGAVQAKHSETYGFNTYKAIFEKGEAKHYNSLDECSKALKLPNLTNTVNKNNEFAIAGKPNEWKRANLPYIDTKDGVWAIRVDPNPYLTTGGLKIDTSCHVLTEKGAVISGLYAAGDVAGSVEQKDGVTYGYGFDSAMAFGAIAADTIANQVK
jgi:fumarate reductase flavoprotein subunit